MLPVTTGGRTEILGLVSERATNGQIAWTVWVTEPTG
jgi:hypothetical protein